MSTDPSGLLGYGYDLGGPDSWLLLQPAVDKYGYLEEGSRFSFVPQRNNLIDDDYEDDDEGLSWADLATNRLLERFFNFKVYKYADPERPENYWELRNAANKALGLEIVMYGSYESKGYMLVTTLFRGPDYGAMEVNPDLIDHSAADRLYRALDALEIQPKQPEPRWILACLYS